MATLAPAKPLFLLLFRFLPSPSVRAAVFSLLSFRAPPFKMSTTSQKHRNFVAEPMNEKLVTDLAGIGEVLGKRLGAKGYDKVGQNFLASHMLEKNELGQELLGP